MRSERRTGQNLADWGLPGKHQKTNCGGSLIFSTSKQKQGIGKAWSSFGLMHL